MLRNLVQSIVPSAIALSAAFMAVPAFATDTTFASFTGLGNSFVATNSGTALSLADTSVVTFSFLEAPFSAVINNVSANVAFAASSPNTNFSLPFAALGEAHQSGFNGSVSFKSKSAYTIGGTTYAAGSNLLTATFTNATISGDFGTQTGSLRLDSKNGILTYTSDFLTFNTIKRDYSFSLTAISPALTDGGGFINSFTSTPTGSFASDPAAVPEPATWAMMLVGLGAMGMSLRGMTARDRRLA